MKAVHVLSAVLVIVGAINWGLVGLAKFDLVHAVFGGTILSSVVYTLVGIAGVYQAAVLAGAGSRRPAYA